MATKKVRAGGYGIERLVDVDLHDPLTGHH